MRKYEITPQQRAFYEGLQVPFAACRILDRQLVPLTVSAGFHALFGDAEPCVFGDVLRDDVNIVEDALQRFASGDERCEIRYRANLGTGGVCHLIHTVGVQTGTEAGGRLVQLWYTDEGAPEDRNSDHADGRYDYLTGLPGMPLFFKTVKAAAGEDCGGAILYLNFRGLRFFNHKYGFAAGNRLLVELAELLARTFGRANCCRFGQDHFAVFTRETQLEDLLGQLFRDCEGLNDGNSLPLRVGICRERTPDGDVSHACDRAKIACDSLRSTYGSKFCYYSEAMRIEARRKQTIKANLDRAIAERWIQVYYQPIVRTANGKVCGDECLARWLDPEEGLIPPDKFIPYLEESGQIYKLDLYVAEQVLEAMRTLRADGIQLVPHSVNLSRSDFDTCDIVEELRRRVDDAGIDRSLIAVEITESTIGSNFAHMKAQIERFRELGFQVWLDDFGSGYSSLDALQSIRFDVIKFDMSFMRKLEESTSSRIVLTELLRLATSLGTDTLCEGVETIEQVHFLQEIGCSKLQGYYYGKPIPFSALQERIAQGMRYGYENPAEVGYYEAIGRVNLYDLSIIANSQESGLKRFFNTLPMGIIEVRGDLSRFVRGNPSYRDFVKRYLGFDLSMEGSSFAPYDDAFMNNVVETCCRRGVRAFFDEQMPNGAIVHSFARRIGVNSLDGTVAVVVGVLSITDVNEGATYASIARALATDYYNIYYVDLDTEQFIEYSSPVGGDSLAVERHGEQFFSQVQRDVMKRIYAEDQDAFLAGFSRERILGELDTHGVFTRTYRLIDTGTPRYASMKVTRLQPGTNQIIMGVSIVDAAAKQVDSVPDDEGAFFQRLVDRVAKPSAVLSVTRDSNGTAGVIRILRANQSYKDTMKNPFYNGMRYDELVPKSLKFESYCYRCAFLGQQIHTYLETKVVNVWTDEQLIPLHSDREDLGYCQMIMEFSEVPDRDRMATVSVRTSSAVLKAAITLLGSSDLKERVGTVLNDILEFSQAFTVRVMLIDHENRRAINYCERLAIELPTDYAPPEEDPDKAIIGYDLICSWEDTLAGANSLVVTNEKEMAAVERRNPVWVRTLRAYDVSNLVLIPLRYDGVIIGYLYICNYDPDQVTEVKELAELMSFFLGTEIYNEILLKRLDVMSHTDALTGLNNRNAMIKRTRALSKQGERFPFGVVNIDLNGLKTVNDLYGHDAGDRLLVSAAEILKKHFYEGDLYRTGGDEFIVIATDIDETAFQRKLGRLRAAVAKNDAVSFAIGACWSDGSDEPSAVFRKADEQMYADKSAFYASHPEQTMRG